MVEIPSIKIIAVDYVIFGCDMNGTTGVWIGGVVTCCNVLACGDGGRVAEEAACIKSAFVYTGIKEIGRVSPKVEKRLTRIPDHTALVVDRVRF